MICLNCGTEFNGRKRKYCDNICSKRYNNRRKNGLDVSEYEVVRPKSNKPVFLKCKVCNKEFRRKKNGGSDGREYTKSCSRKCGAIASYLVKKEINLISLIGIKARCQCKSLQERAKDRVKESKRLKIAALRSEISAARADAIYFYCRECGSDINQVSRVNYKKWCNDCAIKKKMDAKNSYVRINRAKGLMPLGNDRSRAKYYGVDYEPIKRNIVFDKADWCCESCGISTPMSEKGKNNDNSPELDHIIPISKGGPHKYDNVQLLCRACNAIKSDRYDSALA